MAEKISIIEKLGGLQAVKRVLELRGFGITQRSLCRWQEEGRVSGRHYILLMQEADMRNIRYQHSDFCTVSQLQSELRASGMDG